MTMKIGFIGIRSYVDPPHPHLESFMVGMGYHPAASSGRW